MTAVIVGGCGFLGSRIARELRERGEEVVLFDRRGPADGSSEFEYVQGDITNLAALWECFATFRPSVVINLAYVLTTDCEKTPYASLEPNIGGMANVFEASRLSGVGRTLYASSIAVYGPQSQFGERPVTEEDVPQPMWLYGGSKLFNEFLGSYYRRRYDVDVVGVRVSTSFGHGRPEGGIAKWVDRLVSDPARGRAVAIPHPFGQRFPLVYVDDVASYFTTIALAESRPRLPVYLCGGTTTSLGDLAAVVRDLIPDASIEFDESIAHLQNLYIVDDAAAREEFALSRRSVRDGVIAHIEDTRSRLAHV